MAFHKPFIWIDMARNVHYLSHRQINCHWLPKVIEECAYSDVAYKSPGIASNDNGGCFGVWVDPEPIWLLSLRWGAACFSSAYLYDICQCSGFYCVCCGASIVGWFVWEMWPACLLLLCRVLTLRLPTIWNTARASTPTIPTPIHWWLNSRANHQ